MAQQYFSANRNGGSLTPTQITTGTSSTPGADFEFRFNDAVGVKRIDIGQFFKELEVFILNPRNTTTPPI